MTTRKSVSRAAGKMTEKDLRKAFPYLGDFMDSPEGKTVTDDELVALAGCRRDFGGKDFGSDRDHALMMWGRWLALVRYGLDENKAEDGKTLAALTSVIENCLVRMRESMFEATFMKSSEAAGEAMKRMREQHTNGEALISHALRQLMDDFENKKKPELTPPTKPVHGKRASRAARRAA